MNEQETPTTIVVTYPLTLAQIDDQLAALAFVEKPAEVVKAIASCRTLRLQIEDRRKFLKADSLAYGRAVDKAAAELTDRVRKHESPLLERKAQHEAEKAAAKAAKEAAERSERDREAREQLEKERAAMLEEANVQAKRHRIEAEQLEHRRVAIQRAKEEAEEEAALERAKLKAEREAMAAEREANRRVLESVEQARRETQATLDRIEQAKRDEQTRARLAAEAEEQRQAKEKHDAEVAAKVAAAQPDIVKLRAWSDRIGAIRQQAPSCADPDAGALVEAVCNGLSKLCWHLAGFDGSPQEITYPPLHTTVFGEWVDANEH